MFYEFNWYDMFLNFKFNFKFNLNITMESRKMKTENTELVKNKKDFIGPWK